jgi:hypothetical protein
MVIDMPSNGHQFRRYDFRMTMELLKTVFWTDCSVYRKLNSGAVRLGFFPRAEYQKVGQLFHISIG